MKRTTALVAAIPLLAACYVFGEYSVADRGTWPKTWPQELEPLRTRARTLVGPLVAQRHYEIPFTKREDFESLWPHLLKVKTKGAPVILRRSPDAWVGDPIRAGVRIHSPPAQTDKQANPEQPLAHATGVRTRWMWTTYIELIVDGDVVDLNRIPLPADTPIVDERFKDAKD